MSWGTEYKTRLRTPDEALRQVESGMRVYIQSGCSEPETLVEALIRRAPSVHDVEIIHMMTLGPADYVAPEMAGHFRHNALFIGPNVREAVNDGRADYTPVHLSEIEGLFESGAMPIDVALIQLSPPDAQGYCSFGVGVDTSLTAVNVARCVIAQVNDQMPRTHGDSFVPVSQIDAFVEDSRPLCEFRRPEIADVQWDVARNVASLIEDGAVLQTGIGSIPEPLSSTNDKRHELCAPTDSLVQDLDCSRRGAGGATGSQSSSARFQPTTFLIFPGIFGWDFFRKSFACN